VPEASEVDAVFGEGFSGRDVAVYRWLDASMAKETPDDAHLAGRWLASMHTASADFDVPEVLEGSPLALMNLKDRYTDALGMPRVSGHRARVFLERAARGEEAAVEAAIFDTRARAVERAKEPHSNAHHVGALPERIDLGMFHELARELVVLERSKVSHARLPKSMCHGDFHAGNGMIDSETGEFIGIDYDWLAEGECATDLARAVFFWAAKPEGVDAEILKAMMDGYQSVRALDPLERSAMPSLMDAAALRFELRRLANITSSPVEEVKKMPGEFVPDRLAAYRASRGEEVLKSVLGDGCSYMPSPDFSRAGAGRV
jgi:Ser/Thr protein kinase RdoA (MazF antagonist)